MNRLADPAAAAAYVRQVAGHRGWVINPQPELTDQVVEGLAAQAGRFGKIYCPCRDVDGVPGDQDLVCPCAYAGPDIAEYGQCFCGLYLAVGKDPRTVGSIPERRPS